MEVKPVKKETLTEQIMNQLAEQITSGELKPGERLPDERSLAEMFGVTRSRIREALRALSLIGLIDIRPGGGSFVSEQSAQIPKETILWSYHREISDYENLYDARKLIEGTVYLSCFDRRTDEVVDTLQDYAEQLFSLDTNKVSAERFSSLIDEIDTYVGAHCGNGIYDKLMQTMIVLRHESALQNPLHPGIKGERGALARKGAEVVCPRRPLSRRLERRRLLCQLHQPAHDRVARPPHTRKLQIGHYKASKCPDSDRFAALGADPAHSGGRPRSHAIGCRWRAYLTRFSATTESTWAAALGDSGWKGLRISPAATPRAERMCLIEGNSPSPMMASMMLLALT